MLPQQRAAAGSLLLNSTSSSFMHGTPLMSGKLGGTEASSTTRAPEKSRSCVSLAAASLLVLNTLATPQNSMCAPPRTNINQSTRLLAPSYCIAASKTRRRRGRRGSGGDGEVPDGDDGGWWGGGDDYNGGSGGGGDRFWWSHEGPFGGGSQSFLWAWQAICVLCFLQTLSYTAGTVLKPEMCQPAGKDGTGLLVVC